MHAQFGKKNKKICNNLILLYVYSGDDEALLADSKTFTVLIKNNIEFPKFGIKR